MHNIKIGSLIACVCLSMVVATSCSSKKETSVPEETTAETVRLQEEANTTEAVQTQEETKPTASNTKEKGEVLFPKGASKEVETLPLPGGPYEEHDLTSEEDHYLYYSKGRVFFERIDWSKVDLISASEHKICYKDGDYNICMMIVGGTDPRADYYDKLFEASTNRTIRLWEVFPFVAKITNNGYRRDGDSDFHAWNIFRIKDGSVENCFLSWYLSRVSENEILMVIVESPETASRDKEQCKLFYKYSLFED